MATGPVEQRNQDATCYVGNLDEQLSEELLWEMMLQAGPISNVHMPRDKVTGTHQGYGFVEFRTEEDADYALKVMNMVKLFGKPLRVNKASQDKKHVEVGANLFVGGLLRGNRCASESKRTGPDGRVGFPWLMFTQAGSTLT